MSESGQLQELKEKVQDIISKYEERLASAGVEVTASKRYFEVAVRERNNYSYDAALHLFNDIAKYFDKKRERKYKNKRNKYHCIIISVHPVDKNLVRREYCKDYAFVFNKVERAHIGEKPEQTTYAEDKLLLKIEKRILKIIRSAENHGVQKTCKDTFSDVIRYCSSSKYEYKGNILGKELSSWELIFILIFAAITAAVVLACWGISSLL